jgi:hypothetical protein
LDTSNARISIEDPGGRIRSQSMRRSGGRVTIGDGGATSIIDTSNGRITLMIRQ